MDSGAGSLSEAVAAGVELARTAWRRVWAIQLLFTVGIAAVFVALRGPLPLVEAGQVARLGAIMALLAAVPLWGALYRLAADPYGRSKLGIAGLRFGADEFRLIGLGLGFVAAAVLGWLPLVFVSAVIFIVFHDAGQVVLGALGPIQVSFLVVAAAWLSALILFIYACARLATAPAASVAEGRLVILEAWRAGRGRAGRTLAAWVLVQAPALLIASVLGAMDPAQLIEMVQGVGWRWPALDAWGAGLLLGCVFAFVQAPMTVGALSHLWEAGPVRTASPTAALRRMLKPELSHG